MDSATVEIRGWGFINKLIGRRSVTVDIRNTVPKLYKTTHSVQDSSESDSFKAPASRLCLKSEINASRAYIV